MPIDFGSQKINREIPGVGVLLSGTEREILDHQRRAQQARQARPRQRGTLKESERLQVYIYNVGPFTRVMDTLGSIGTFVIPGLPEFNEQGKSQVLQGMNVAGPVIIPGLPAEPYPGEPRGQWLELDPEEYMTWTEADGEVWSLKDRPGIDLALRIIGAHQQSRSSAYLSSPYDQGCFVSTVMQRTEPKAPKEPGDKSGRGAIREYEKAMIDYEEEVRLFLKWEANWNAAKDRFTAWAMRRGEEQSLAYANQNYVRDEELFVLSRIFHKTESDWPFLAGVSANVKSKACWSCGRAMKADLPKCQCGELQISPAEYAALREKHTGVAA